MSTIMLSVVAVAVTIETLENWRSEKAIAIILKDSDTFITVDSCYFSKIAETI